MAKAKKLLDVVIERSNISPKVLDFARKYKSLKRLRHDLEYGLPVKNVPLTNVWDRTVLSGDYVFSGVSDFEKLFKGDERKEKLINDALKQVRYKRGDYDWAIPEEIDVGNWDLIPNSAKEYLKDFGDF